MNRYIAIYYPENPQEDEPAINPLYSVTLEDAIREAENELICPYVSVEIIEYMKPGETINQYEARERVRAYIR